MGQLFRAAALFCVPVFLMGCSIKQVDQADITVEPSFTKGSKFTLTTPDVTRFVFSKTAPVDWNFTYASCVSRAGAMGVIALLNRDYDDFKTVDIDQADNVSDAQMAQAFGCMKSFSDSQV